MLCHLLGADLSQETKAAFQHGVIEYCGREPTSAKPITMRRTLGSRIIDPSMLSLIAVSMSLMKA